MKKNPQHEEFLKEHLPKVPDFKNENLPKFDPGYTLGPPVKPTGDRDFLDFYFNNDVRHLQADIHARPDHYTREQKDIVAAIAAKRPLPPGTGKADLNELVLRLMEKTEYRKKREATIQKAQKKLSPEDKPLALSDDPTIERIVAAQRAHDQSSFENQAAMPKAIKII